MRVTGRQHHHAPAPAPALSKYEVLRAENIARNKAYLDEIGLGENVKIAEDGQRRAKKRKLNREIREERRKELQAAASAAPPRRSSRRTRGGGAASAPDYYGEVIKKDAAPSWPELQQRAAKRKKQSTAELLEKSERWLAESRERLVAQSAGAGGAGGEEGASAATPGAEGWRRQAVARWGAAVERLPPATTDWEAYVLSRGSTPPPRSPLELMQEDYAACPWRLLVACVLMSRVSVRSLIRHRRTSAFSWDGREVGSTYRGARTTLPDSTHRGAPPCRMRCG